MSLCPYCESDYNEEDCEHFVLVYDRTFPFATGDSRCPLSIQSHSLDVTSLDDLIAAEAQKFDTLKTHKKGLMQQLFPQVGEGDE